MATTLNHLLPAPDDTVRCAEHARTITLDPGGTAIAADRVVLVATPSPWPKPALGHPMLRDLRAVMAQSPVATRLLAMMDDGSSAGHGGQSEVDDAALVIVFERDGGGAIERRYQVADGADLARWGQAMIASDYRAAAAWALPGMADPRPARPAVLICTQGSHDVCCGSEGVRFAAEVENALDLDVYRVSHTGGHRFAPTALTLPDGRMWADLDLDALRAIMAGAGDIDDVVDRCRGWWGAATGPAQIAERAVLAQVGWALNDLPRSVEIAADKIVGEAVDEASGVAGALQASITATVQAGADTWKVQLAPGRVVPSIACRQPGGLPAKQAQEFDVLAVARQ